MAPVDAVARLSRKHHASRKILSSPRVSNGDVSLLVDMANMWDCRGFLVELFHHYKPDREAYLGAVDFSAARPAKS